MIDTDKYEGHTRGPWYPHSQDHHGKIMIKVSDDYWKEIGQMRTTADKLLAADAPLLLEFIQKVVEEWGKPNQCNQAFGKDVRHLMLEYGLISFNEETRRYEVKE